MAPERPRPDPARRAEDVLLAAEDIRTSLALPVSLERSESQPQSVSGDVLKAAAADSAFEKFSGRVLGEIEVPFALSSLVLVFASEAFTQRMFQQVAQAAHLSTDIEGCRVAVETVPSEHGIVSYWAFVQKKTVLVVLTLDSPDPMRLSVGDLRSVVAAQAEKLGSLLA